MKYKHKQLIKTHLPPVHRTNFPLSPNNRLSYIFKTTDLNEIVEITCVSLEILVKKRWITIIYYDSSHGGRLHRHTLASLKDDADVVNYLHVKKKGGMNTLLNWAINDIKINFITYKKKVIKRSRDAGVNHPVDLY